MTLFAAEACLAWAPLSVAWARLSPTALAVRFADGVLWRMALHGLASRIGWGRAGLALVEQVETVVMDLQHLRLLSTLSRGWKLVRHGRARLASVRR